MNRLKSDVTIVGGGVAGLWSAKELIDRGASITLIEKSHGLANGATTRNEGWLHAGTYHSVAVADQDDALRVTERTLYGHDAIVAFAPESIDHERSIAFTANDELTEAAVKRWDMAGVVYRETDPAIFAVTEGIDIDHVRAAFEVKDKSVNSVVLCRKLARYIIEHGGRIITNTEFIPTGSSNAELIVGDDERYSMESERFLITAGAGIKDLVETITGKELLMRYFQAHLMVTPRLTHDNYFFLDNGEAGIMSHGNTSIIGINRDGIERTSASYVPVPAKEKLVYDAVKRMLPRAKQLKRIGAQMVTVACCKPDIYKSTQDTQSLNVQVFEPAPGYLCALPGKMTESPFLGREAARRAFTSSMLGNSDGFSQNGTPEITLRPADHVAQTIGA